jgi:hypothetical protein
MKKLKQFLLSEGLTTHRYQQRADTVCKAFEVVGIVMIIVGIICCTYIIGHKYTALMEVL